MLISLLVTATAKESGQFCVKVLDSFIKKKTKTTTTKKPKHLIPDIIKTKKKTIDYFLKVYFGIENTKNVINMTFLLSILCHYVKMLYRILCWETLGDTFQGELCVLLRHFNTELTVFLILNMLILHAKNLISDILFLLI